MKRREFLGRSLSGLAAASTLASGLGSVQAWAERSAEVAESNVLDPPKGESYQAEVPDTLDLAERAVLAIQPLTEYPDLMGGDNACAPKMFEALPLLRGMSGSSKNSELEQGNLNKYILSRLGEDGLLYFPGPNGPYACMLSQGRLLRAMTYYHQVDGEEIWLERMRKLAESLKRIAIEKDDYAYFPTASVFYGSGFQEPFSYLKNGGWQTREEPPGLLVDPPYHQDPNYRDGGPNDGHWYDGRFGVHMYLSGPIEGLTRWHRVSGDEGSLELAGKLVRFVTQPRYWNAVGEPAWMQGAQHAHYLGHLHGHVAQLRAILEYAITTNNDQLKQFARDGYEYSKNFYVAPIGYFTEWTRLEAPCETCEVADMIGLAVRLTDAGMGDYWDDVDGYVRNQFAEQQHIGGLPDAVGSFVLRGQPTRIEADEIAGCCTENASQALYYAWSGIVHENNDIAQVNLLLNRASSLLDVDSYLPYEGKVILKNKGARAASVRIPAWVDRKALAVSLNGRTVPVVWDGHRILVDSLKPKDSVVIQFPLRRYQQKITINHAEYVYEFKGSTVVDVSPRGQTPRQDVALVIGGHRDKPPEGYVEIYERDAYKQDRAPTVAKARYVPSKLVVW